MDNGAITVTVVVTSGILTPLAWIIVVPAATEVTGIVIVGALLPSQMKFAVAGTVATSGLLEDKVMGKPGTGAVVERRNVSGVWFPKPTMLAFCVTHVTLALTFTVSGAGGA